MKAYWNRFLHWRGWRIIFPLPVCVEALLFFLCCAGLVWVFANDLAQWLPANFLYALSAYSLTDLCIKLPSVIRKRRNWLQNHPKTAEIFLNRELRLSAKLYLKQILNFSYGAFKLISGVIIGSAWIGADGIYNFVQALIQLFQILRRKKPGTREQQWKAYRFCGVLAILMHLTMVGIVFQMVNWNRVAESGEIVLIGTAAFAFYKLISSVIGLTKDRKHTYPIDSSVRMLGLSQAIFAIYSLQAGLLHTFGAGEPWEHYMNLAVGCAVCLLTVAMGIYMILRANREINRQERENG